MSETPSQKPALPHASTLTDSAKAAWNRLIRIVPTKARLGLLTGSLFLVALATYTYHVSASPKKLYDILGKRSETFSKSLTVPSGEHVVHVHLSSATDRFDQIKQHDLNLPAGSSATLMVSAQQSGMSLVYEGHMTTPTKNLGSTYSDSLRSVLVTLLGSGVSATIGFFVQEFLRSKKKSSQQAIN